jgi:hypothetical protein
MADNTNEQQEKTFTQADIDRIVGERLSRDGVQDSKEIVELLKEFDYSGTPAEVKAALKIQAESYKRNKAEHEKQAEIDELNAQSQNTGTSPEILAEIKELKTKLADIEAERLAKKAEIENKVKTDSEWATQIKEFSTEYPDVILDELNENAKFIKFAKGKKMPLKEIYADYLELIGETALEATAKVTSKASRSAGSSTGKVDSGTYHLTTNQQQLAADNGMSLKEYAEMLSLVKK